MKLSEVATATEYGRNLYLEQTEETSFSNDRESSGNVQNSNFDYMRDVAIAHLEKTLSDQLNILNLKGTCDFTNMENLSKFVFTWCGKQFLKRRTLKNCVWIDVLQLQTKEDCLERFKLETDLKEIKIFLKSIFQGLQKSQDNLNLDTLVYNPLRKAERDLIMLEILYKKNEKLKQVLQNQKCLINDLIVTRRTTRDQYLLLGIEEAVIKLEISVPIKSRLAVNWYQNQTNQAQFKYDLSESCIQNEIANYKFKILSEEIAGDAIRDTYYALAEEYKTIIDVLQNSLNSKIEEIDNEINYMRLESSKMAEQENLLRKQIEIFHMEIAERLKREERQRDRKELERLILEEQVKNRASRRKAKIKTNKNKKKIKLN